MQPLNEHVLAVCAELPRSAGYLWPTSDPRAGGCFENVRFKGATLLEARDGATYCCGLVFEILFRAWARANYEPPLTIDQAKGLRAGFFCQADRTGPHALARYGLGEIVSPENARPGDFAQLWRRGGSGHSVIVLGYEEGKLLYLSTQKSTSGVGEKAERPAELYVARAVVPDAPEGTP